MRLAWIVGLAASACGGRASPPEAPSGLSRVMLVGCAPATPAPILEDDGVTFGGLERHPEPAPILDAATLNAALRPHMQDFRSCYVRELAANPDAMTRTALAFTIQADGRVTDVVAGPTSLTQCMQRVFATVKFPPLPGGGTVRVRYPLTEQAGPALPPADPNIIEPPPSDRPWTPFAIATSPPPDGAEFLARTAEPVVRERLDTISACFRAVAPTGSLRAMLDLDSGGHVRRVRAGGLGDVAAETCVARALEGIEVANPAHADGIELACDLSRGDAERWRVAPDPYDVIHGARDVVTHAGARFDPGASVPDPLPAGRTYLIVLDPDAPGRVLETALALAENGDAALVAIHQPHDAPPLLVGAGRSDAALGAAHEEPGALELAFDLSSDYRLAACLNGHADSVGLAVPKRVDALLAQVAARCRTQHCTRSAGLAVGPDIPASAVATAVAALRRAGFERVVIGGGLGCR